MKLRHISTGVMVAAGYLSREEALFWLSLTITVLQLIYDFYKAYTARKDSMPPGPPGSIEYIRWKAEKP